eukprot:15168520-Alexandrium_andersonii.AAC.1
MCIRDRSLCEQDRTAAPAGGRGKACARVGVGYRWAVARQWRRIVRSAQWRIEDWSLRVRDFAPLDPRRSQ